MWCRFFCRCSLTVVGGWLTPALGGALALSGIASAAALPGSLDHPANRHAGTQTATRSPKPCLRGTPRKTGANPRPAQDSPSFGNTRSVPGAPVGDSRGPVARAPVARRGSLLRHPAAARGLYARLRQRAARPALPLHTPGATRGRIAAGATPRHVACPAPAARNRPCRGFRSAPLRRWRGSAPRAAAGGGLDPVATLPRWCAGDHSAVPLTRRGS